MRRQKQKKKAMGKPRQEGWAVGGNSALERSLDPSMSLYLELQLSHSAFTLQTQALSNWGG